MPENIQIQMENILHNAKQLHSNLSVLGFQFTHPEMVIGRPDPELAEKLQPIEKQFMHIPRALRIFYEVIGSLDFSGSHPEWNGCEYPDPLFVDPVDTVVSEFKMWNEDPEIDRSCFSLPIAPDMYHKENVSGDMFYNVVLPCLDDDPIISDEWHHTTFLNYLHTCFVWGGFPGLEKSSDHTWPLEKMKKGLQL
jgi:hypothetical protein